MIAAGLRAARLNLGPIVWTYLASLMSAFPLALAGGMLIHRVFGHSEEAVAVASRLDVERMMELVTWHGEALGAYVPLVMGAMVFWACLSAFLTGAVLVAVSTDGPTPTGELFSGGGRVFGRMLRLMLFGIPSTVLLVGLTAWGASKLTGWVTEDWISEKGTILFRVSITLLILLVLAWCNAAYDLMKVEAVAKGEHRARYAFWRGLVRAVRHPLQVFGVYVPFVVASILVTLLFSLIDVQITRSSWILVIVGFALQQIAAFIRAFLRVALAGAEVAYVRAGR